ncbi:hypothetical protein GCM10028807_32900 [Spirosoma daeguense]
MEQPRDDLFRYHLNIKVWFMVDGKPHEGWLLKRRYIQEYHGPDWDYPDARISQDTIYTISSKGKEYDFKEWEFSSKVYTDKQKFIDECVIIK